MDALLFHRWLPAENQSNSGNILGDGVNEEPLAIWCGHVFRLWSHREKAHWSSHFNGLRVQCYWHSHQTIVYSQVEEFAAIAPPLRR